MGKQTRSTTTSTPTSSPPASDAAAGATDGSTAYADPMVLQGAPGGGNAAALAALGKPVGSEPTEECGGVGMVSSGTQVHWISKSLDDIYEQQTNGLHVFEDVATGQKASFSEKLAVKVAEAIISTAITDVSNLAVSAVAAYTGVGAVVGGAFLAGARAAQSMIAGEVASRVVGAVTKDPSADWVKGFVEAQAAALFEGQRATGAAWLAMTDGMDASSLCAMNDALDAVVDAAEGVQYRHCVAGWAQYCGEQASGGIDAGDDQQNEGFAREYELRVDVSLDAADPRKVTVNGGAIPGLSPDLLRHPHMAGVTVGNAGFVTRVVLSGGQILVGAGGRVIEVRADAVEAREQLRRLGSADEKSAAPASWKATTGALGDDLADLHVQNGAQKLVSLHIAPKTLESLGLAAPGAE